MSEVRVLYRPPLKIHTHKKAILGLFSYSRILSFVLPIFSYWYLTSANRFLDALRGAWQGIESEIGIVDTFHNLDKPLFQDYSRQGRVIGFVFRIARILAGITAMAVTAFGYALLYVVWLLFPPLCLASIAGSAFGA